MKNILRIFLIVSNSLIFAQVTGKPACFSSSEFGVYGGMNFNTLTHIYGSVFFEARTNLSSNINLKASAGYNQIYSFEQYTVNTYKYVHIDDYRKYKSIIYNVLKTKYEVIPFSVGAQFVLNNNVTTYYTFFDVTYNLIDPLTFQSSETSIGEYDSMDDIPNEFKETRILPNNSYGFSIGVGAMYQLFSSLNLDIRYLYKYDSEIIDTHQLLIGFVF